MFLLAALNASAETFQVAHLHFWRSCKGKLVFSDARVEFLSDNKKHTHAWNYPDIQQLALAPDRISILTYNTRKSKLGADQLFQFQLLSGKVDEQFRTEIEKKLARPLVSSVVPEKIQAQFVIPVRHRLFLSDSQGVLEFGAESIVYRSDKPNDSRVWRYDQLLSVGSTGPFQLRIGALQKTSGEFGEEKNYVFDLKRQLTPEEYDFIWNKINIPKIQK